MNDMLVATDTFELDADFEVNGAWAAIGQLVEAAYLRLVEAGVSATIAQYDYALYLALPRHRHCIRPRRQCLTDTAVGIERTRFYPVERAYRVIHGLVGFVLHAKRELCDDRRWTVVVRNLDRAQHLSARAIGELTRRGPAHGIDVVVQPQGNDVTEMAVVPADAAAWMQQIDGGAEAVLEERFPVLLQRYRNADDRLTVAQLAFKALVICNRRGYYHEGKSLLPDILPCFDQLVGSDEAKRMSSVSEINSCLVATGDGDRALQIVRELAVPYVGKASLLAHMNYVLAMHHLRYLEAKDVDRAEYFILNAAHNVRVAEEAERLEEHAFLRAFIDNGLAFLRVRQKRHQEALDLCSAAYDAVTRQVGEDRHLLHRSVLQYNMAQVYAMLGHHDESLASYRHAIAMDPFYAEYHAESGNILQQLGRNREAIECYAEALRCSPHYPEVLYRKAICHAGEGELSEALSCSEACLELSPDQPDLIASRAEMLTELGQVDAALAEFDRAIAGDGESIALRVNRAVLHFNQGSYDLALADMNDVIARDAQNPAHYENRAAIYQATEHRELCQRDLAIAAQLAGSALA
jgi:tetratricopeptide (TPR) repeat protein